MSYCEVEELRKSGNLEGAYHMAISDMNVAIETDLPPIILHELSEEKEENHQEESLLTLAKRVLSWVIYDHLKKNTSKENFDKFLNYLKEIVEIDLAPSEKMVVNQLIWEIGKAVFEFTKQPGFDISKMEALLDVTMKLNFSRQSKAYSFLFKAFHKALKDSNRYIDFASWWDLWNFISHDYKFTLQGDGKKIMAVAEQGINQYAKHLLRAINSCEDKEEEEDIVQKIANFIPIVEKAIEYNKHYFRLPYYHIKLLFAKGDIKTGYTLLKKRIVSNQNDFWVWELMADVFAEEPSKQIASMCKALQCKTNLENVIQMRVRLTSALILDARYDEAKTEIGLILRACLENKCNIPDIVTDWGEDTWYNLAIAHSNNFELYESFKDVVDEIMYGNIPERKIIVENVNNAKKILNFLGTDYTKGYLKYDKTIKHVKEGDVLLARIKDSGVEGRYNLFSAKKLKEKYVDGILKHFAGEVIKLPEKSFAFADGMYITPDFCAKTKLDNGDYISGRAMIAYNVKKEEWGWKVISIDK